MAAQLTFTMSVPGDRFAQIQRSLGRFSAGVQDLRQPFDEIADDFLAVEQGQFATLGAAESGGWAPLNPEYAKWKTKAFPGQPLLVRTGRLRAALTTTNGDSIRSVQPLELRLGVNDGAVPYAKFHQSGTLGSFEQRDKVEGLPGMPRRPPVEFSEKTRKRWVLTIRRYLVKLARGVTSGSDADSIGRRA
jgi:phage gpG-like protein